MASLWKRKGVYYARYYVGGKQRAVCLHTTSHQTAKEKLRRFETRLAEHGEDALPTKTPVAEVLQAYVRHILVAKTKAGVKSDLYYLRDIFGPVCKELEVKQKDARARAHRAYLPAKYLEQIRTQDIVAFLPLPAAPFDACRTVSTRADRLSLVRFDANDYSVPVRYAHHEVTVKGYVDTVLICRDDEVIAEHARRWGKEDIAFEPIHYLELLDRKPGALDYARPLVEWELPECFHLLRGRLHEEGASGTREYIRVLRLLEKHPLHRVTRAIEKALTLRRCTRDVVFQFLYPDPLPAVPTFTLDGREHLQGIRVAMPDLRGYAALVGGTN